MAYEITINPYNGRYQSYPDSPFFKAPWADLPPNFKREQQVIDAEAEIEAKEEAEAEEKARIWFEEEMAKDALKEAVRKAKILSKEKLKNSRIQGK